MASTITHLAIAKELKKNLNIEKEYDYYLGAIAPDLSKQIGNSKEDSHFLINTQDETPNIDLFIKRYPLFKYNSFELGYFIHLYTDKLWKEEFLPTILEKNSIKLLDGTTIKSSKEEIYNLIYSDYTNLNKQLIDEYELDLSLFYEEFKKPNTVVKEIPVENLDILINKIGIILENSRSDKTYTFDLDIIKDFISKSVEIISKEIKKY